MEDETPTSAADEAVGAPGTEAASGSAENGAPATSLDGYIEQKRYDDLRSNHDRINSLVDRARSGDSEALRELTGFDFADDEEVPDPDDEPEMPRDPRVDQILHERELEQQRAFVAGVSGHIGDLLKDSKVELPKPLAEGILPAVFAAAGDGPLNESTTEQVVKQWTQAITEIKKQAVQDFIKSKTDAPFVAPGGTGATDEVLPLDASRSERQRWMAERYSLGQQP